MKCLQVILTLSVLTASGEDCVICLEPICDSHILIKLSCNHTFHAQCIISLIDQHSSYSCPLCRTVITQTFEQEREQLRKKEEQEREEERERERIRKAEDEKFWWELMNNGSCK